MRWALVLVMVAPAMMAAGAQESLPLKTVAAIKDATVMITTIASNGDPGGSGSGFLIRVDGQTAYVATNHHVISPPKLSKTGRPIITVVLRCGARGERRVPAEVAAASAEPDLAILKIIGVPNLPAPIDVLKETELFETMAVWVFGFPFGEGLALGRGNPSVVVGKGSVSSVRRDLDDKVLMVLIDGALNPGNSGGPVVDAQGRLVGVAVASIHGANIGFTIPRPELLAMFSGRPGEPRFTASANRDGTAELAIEVPLLDPFDSVKNIALLYEIGGTGPVQSRPTGQETSSWKPLSDAAKLELKLAAKQGRGSFSIKVEPGKDVDLIYQFAVLDAQGRRRHTKPGHYFLSVLRAAASGGKAAAIRLWGDAIDPDGDCKILLDKGGLSFGVPGTLHDLNRDFSKMNSPRVVQDVDGDFIAQVKVCGEFRPTGPATRPGGTPFNGAGLLLWLDAGQFIRLERAEVLQEERVGAFVLFERHEIDGPALLNTAYLEQGDVYLRIERRGNRISGFYGTDGQQWAEVKPVEVHWPARLKVGLDVVNSAFSPLSVRFEEFSIKKPGPEPTR